MNGKKPSRFQFHFSGVLEACSMLKKWFFFPANLDFGDNLIYPISNPERQDKTEGSIFLREKVDFL